MATSYLIYLHADSLRMCFGTEMPTAQLTQLSRLERVGASHTQKFGLISPGFWAQGGHSPCGRILWLCSCLVIDSSGLCSGTGLAPALEN